MTLQEKRNKMRRLIPASIAMLLIAPIPASAVAGPESSAARIAAEREAMRKFSWMDGEWRGVAVTQTPAGEQRVTHTERVGSTLDGSVRLIEGRSYRADGSTAFHALAMLSFDPDTRSYRLTSHAEGRYGSFPLVPTASGYSWEIASGPVTIRYTATFQDGVWTETGVRVVGAGSPTPFFRMELKRIGDSSWPEGGGVKPL